MIRPSISQRWTYSRKVRGVRRNTSAASLIVASGRQWGVVRVCAFSLGQPPTRRLNLPRTSQFAPDYENAGRILTHSLVKRFKR